MASNDKSELKAFELISILTLIFYVLAVGVTIFFKLNDYEKLIATSIKLVVYAAYLGLMVWSLTLLKNYWERTRKDDFSIDILIYALVGIPVYIFSFFYVRRRLKSANS